MLPEIVVRVLFCVCLYMHARLKFGGWSSRGGPRKFCSFICFSAHFGATDGTTVGEAVYTASTALTGPRPLIASQLHQSHPDASIRCLGDSPASPLDP